jgi:hypothetical protein
MQQQNEPVHAIPPPKINAAMPIPARSPHLLSVYLSGRDKAKGGMKAVKK